MRHLSIRLRLISLVGLLFSLSAAAADSSVAEYPPVKISVYSIHPNSPTYLASSQQGAEQIPFYSGSVSEWIEVIPPITFSTDLKSGPKSSWVPSIPGIDKWIIILSGDSGENGKLHLMTLPATKSSIPNSTLVLGNLMHEQINGEYNGHGFILKSQTFEIEKLRSNRISIDARTVTTPYYCNIMIPNIEAERRYLLLMAPPHVKGSAMMMYRLVKIPDSLYTTETHKTP